MSWVAEQNAMIQKQTSVVAKNAGVGSRNATPAIVRQISNCMATIHHRLVLNRSTNGLQNGLITQGR